MPRTRSHRTAGEDRECQIAGGDPVAGVRRVRVETVAVVGHAECAVHQIGADEVVAGREDVRVEIGVLDDAGVEHRDRDPCATRAVPGGREVHAARARTARRLEVPEDLAAVGEEFVVGVQRAVRDPVHLDLRHPRIGAQSAQHAVEVTTLGRGGPTDDMREPRGGVDVGEHLAHRPTDGSQGRLRLRTGGEPARIGLGGETDDQAGDDHGLAHGRCGYRRALRRGTAEVQTTGDGQGGHARKQHEQLPELLRFQGTSPRPSPYPPTNYTPQCRSESGAFRGLRLRRASHQAPSRPSPNRSIVPPPPGGSLTVTVTVVTAPFS